jgi:CheY-like chemotaxis protein
LSEDIPKNSPFYNDVQQIIRTSEKATELTSRLLAYAQEGSKQMHQLDINQLIKEVAGILSRTLDKSVTIRAELNSELASVVGDPGQIQHAILEVTLNARDALSNGGKIVFQTGHIELNENTAQMHSEAKPGKYVQLTISDSGVGMSSEVKEQIFEPYFTTKKEEDPSRGLGLSMVQEIIEKHGGFISVFSEKNKGTVFKIHLPACEKPMKSSRKAPTQDAKPTLGKETILLVANENVLKQTARKMLTRYGYKVICADSGTEAIAIYKKYTKRVNLVILDLIMTGMETSKILTWLKKLNPKVKIIAAAGLGEKELFDKSVRANLSAVIQKPYQVRPLLQQVRNVLNA